MDIKVRWFLAVAMMLLLLGQASVMTSRDAQRDEVAPIIQGEAPLLWTNWGAFAIKDLMDRVPTRGSEIEDHIWIVQFDGPIQRPMRDALTDAGIVIEGYLPDFAYIVDIGDRVPDSLKEFDHVLGTSPFPYGLKVMPDVFELFDSMETVYMVEGADSIIVDLFSGASSAGERLSEFSPWVQKASPTRYVVGLPVSSLRDLISLPEVRWVEPNPMMELHNNVSRNFIGVPEVFNTLGLTGKGQLVTVADTGIDTGVDDPDVNGDMFADLDNRVTPVYWAGYSAIDTHSHGTHVTGSVAGNGTLSNGEIQGMAPEADIFFQSIANESYYNYLTGIPSNLSLLFQQAYDKGSRVHTNSWGSSAYGYYSTSSQAVDWFLYHFPDMIILFSAGNSGRDYYNATWVYGPDGKIDPDSIGSPATAKNCITVGAGENMRSEGGYQFQWATGSWASKFSADPVKTDKMSDDPRGLAAFSSRGPTDDGRLKPDVIAPGTNILSARSTQTSSTGWGTWSYNSNYLFMGGTSMSCPITAGAVVLLRQYFNETLGMSNPSGALLKATLINGAQDMTPGQYGTSDPVTQEINRRPDNDQGWGRINISESLQPENGDMTFIDNLAGFETGDRFQSTLSVASSSKDLRLSLVWADYPGDMAASKKLVNDLDLWVQAPNGTIYRGNDFIAPFSDTADRTNPVEGISIGSPSVGVWTVFIDAHNIPMGPQHFALVASGDISNFSGALSLDERFYSTDGDVINIELLDRDISGQGTVSVNVASNTLPAGRTLTLTESSVPGRFTGTITTHNATTSNTSLLPVFHNDTIIVTYSDADPSGNFNTTAVAKNPVRFYIYHKPSYGLVHSENEEFLLRGRMERGTDAWWMLENYSMEWRPLRDDGSALRGDTSADDGNFSDRWYVPDNSFGTHTLIVAIEDPFLGNRTYRHFDLELNTSVPRFPKNLTYELDPRGNGLSLDWDDTDEMDISHYGIYVNSSMGSLWGGKSGWDLLINTSGAATQAHVSGLVDGVDYSFRVSAFDLGGNESSLSVWINATPEDATPPIINLVTTPYTIVGKAYLEFVGSPDLEMVELEYYNDSNGNGQKDDGDWEPAGTGHPSNFTWDTSPGAGGPGDIDRMFLRYRGYDEVPNISNWTEATGFRIDNTGPNSVEILNPPPRITRTSHFDLTGRSEADGRVEVFLNGLLDSDNPCDAFGGFGLSLDLAEGLNNVTLAAYDQHGAGPTNRTYFFTLDTMEPVAMLDTEDQVVVQREIIPEGHIFTSSSYDTGLDEMFRYIENITWTYRGPDNIAKVSYANEYILLPLLDLGNHNLTLEVRDPAGNSNSTTLMIQVYDGTPPIVKIDGPMEVGEDLTQTYTANYTDNDPRAHIREGFSLGWIIKGPMGFTQNHSDAILRIFFPEPGEYVLNLTVTDGGNNTNSTTLTVTVADRTPPSVDIIGPGQVILGIPETYKANVNDNDPDFPNGAVFHWNLSYVDGPPDEQWYLTFDGSEMEFNFTTEGLYTLLLKATDGSGNSRELLINIQAIGDLTPPWVAEILPAVNNSWQFIETTQFTVRFNELMNKSTITMDSVYLEDEDGNKVNISLEVKDVQGRTEAKLVPGSLEFERTYTVVVKTGVRDDWENGLEEEFRANFTIRTQFKLVYPWGETFSEVFGNISNDTVIKLRFSNPILASSLQNRIVIKTPTTVTDVLGNERIEMVNVPFDVVQGDTLYEALLHIDMDQGVKYNITISAETLDIFNYPLDQEYTWDFTTYIPPSASDDDEDDDDEDPWPDWMSNPVYWIILAVSIILLFLIIVIIGAVMRRRNLKKMWEQGQEEPPRKREEPEPIRTMEEEYMPQETETAAAPPPSYEDLYGSPAPSSTPEQSYTASTPMKQEYTEEMFTGSRSFSPPPPMPDFDAPKSKGIEWDEDEEDEDWGDSEEEEEDWGEEEGEEELTW
ncbi:MAG: S8 family serine peptidase [Thermoplasmatota archaeon]